MFKPNRHKNGMHHTAFPKTNPHTKFGIPTAKNLRYVPDLIMILETRSEFKVTMTQGLYMALGHLKMHPHTEFGILTSKNIGDMYQSQCRT